ncbi:hypothetical protein CK203_081300 [Vitis vinifera]|uniref:Uncharacterized protein n=1 Tax=Vitis vinifera TaxID=29760 RepID=A0A438DAP5_VITVI|nr:hypothetical protein CK203_081300 [Vitis vinifera]
MIALLHIPSDPLKKLHMIMGILEYHADYYRKVGMLRIMLPIFLYRLRFNATLKVMGTHVAITVNGSNCHFELNVFKSVTASGFPISIRATYRDDGFTAPTAVLVGNHLYVANVEDLRGPLPAGFHSRSRGHGVSCSIRGSILEYHENEGESAAASTDQIESPHEENAREKRKSGSSKTDVPLLLDLQEAWIEDPLALGISGEIRKHDMHLTVIATGENQFKKFILMILAANAAVGVITETNAEKALEELYAY